MPSATLPHDVCALPATKSFTLRCIVYHQKSSGFFVAECIDLDLMVKARKAKKAMRELEDAIKGYVQVAVETGQADELIPRRSPISHRLRYHLAGLAFRLSLLSEVRLFDCTQTAHAKCYA
jgi:hypothetical protein